MSSHRARRPAGILTQSKENDMVNRSHFFDIQLSCPIQQFRCAQPISLLTSITKTTRSQISKNHITKSLNLCPSVSSPLYKQSSNNCAKSAEWRNESLNHKKNKTNYPSTTTPFMPCPFTALGVIPIIVVHYNILMTPYRSKSDFKIYA